MNNYLAAESLITARLRAQIPNITVQSTWSMHKVMELPELPPAVLVVLEADLPGEITFAGKSQKVEQIWNCIVVVKDAENEAGPLISKVIQAMSGWQPDMVFTPFKRVKSGFAHEYSPSTAFYFPVAFATSFVFNI